MSQSGEGARPAKAGSQRFENIDIVRGIAALMVVFQHASERAGIFGPEQHFLINWFNPGQAGVVAFFLVSGFVIPLSLERGRSLKRFATSRILRIYPLYLFVFLFTYLIVRGDMSVGIFLAQIAFASEYIHSPNYVGNSWTLAIELAWYVLFAVLFALRLNRSTAIIAGAFAVLLIAASVVTLIGLRLPMGRIGMLATCVVGLLCYRARAEAQLGPNVLAGAVLILCILAGLIVGFGLVEYHGKVEFNLRSILLSWGAGYALFFASFFMTLPDAPGRLLRKLGEISFSVYLMHTFALRIVSATALAGWSYILLVFALTVAMSLVTYSWIELPAIRFSHRWPKRDPKAIKSEPVAITAEG